MQRQYSTLTVKYPVRQSELKTPVEVQSYLDLTKKNRYTGLWDTGATNCMISSRVASELQLQPTGITEVGTAMGTVPCNVYDVIIVLPNKIKKHVTATEGSLGEIDVLIGMDIIADGDFAISTDVNTGEMFMTHRSPSIGKIDFTERAKRYRYEKSHRNNTAKNKRERQNRKKARRH